MDPVVSHIFKLSQMDASAAARVFQEKIAVLDKNMLRALTKDTTKLWPGIAELALLRLVGTIWSTSDMNHAVVVPARLLIGAYLELGRVNQLKDIGKGLFLCTLFLQVSF